MSNKRQEKKPPSRADQMMAARLERVLTNDPGIGVARHVDAGYPEAARTARKHKLKLPS